MGELLTKATPGLAVAGAALATVWLFDPALHPEPESTAAGVADPSDTAGGAEDADGAADGAGTDESADSGGTPDPGGSAGEGAADPERSSAADQNPPGDCSSTTTTLTGDAAMTRWGPVQVRAEVAADGSLCDVTAVAYPDGDRKSAQINAAAIPSLDAQAGEVGVAFQSISGATYTSEAYRQSLQSILDQL